MRKPFSIYRKLLCIVAQVFVFFAASAATVGEESVVSLLITDGLAGETVYNVMTEHSGQTWIATNSGVNAYDGKKMYTFRMVGEQGRYLTVYDVCETTNRSIWAATEGGLYCMEYGEDHFKRVLPEVHQAICLLAVGDTVYIGGDDTTSVIAIENLKTENEIVYDLQGRRVMQPTKGLYIINGKKTMIR